MKKSILFYFHWFLSYFSRKAPAQAIQEQPEPGSINITVKTGPQYPQVSDSMREIIAGNLFEDQQAMQRFMLTYIIPDAKISAVKEHIAALRVTYPHMKPDRICRYAADYFHLEKITDAIARLKATKTTG